MLAALRLVFNATALLALLTLTAALGIAALHGRELPWEQLVLGRLLAEAGSIPAHEGLLFTASPAAAFDARSWAWDWTACQAFRLYGPSALRLADSLVWLLAIWALVAAAFRRGARPFSTALFTAWALLAARTDLGPGPGSFGFAAFCAALWIMEGDFWDAFFGRWIWLGPLAVLAVNVSPLAWFLAPLALCQLYFGADAIGAPRQPRLAKTAFFTLLMVCLCLHPQGASALTRIPLGLGASPLLPGAFEPRQAALLLLAAAALLWIASSWTRAGRRHLGRDGSLLLFFGAAALISRDALPFLLAVSAPAAAARFDMLTDALPSPLRALRWPAKVAAFAALVAWAVSGGLRALPAAEESAAPRPAQTVAFYGTELLDLDILCPPEWTPALAWKLAPNARFALDPRGLAQPARAAALRDALNARGDFAATLAVEGVGLCWLPRGSPLSVALAESQAWQPLSFDDASVVYLPVVPANAELIRARAPRGLRPGDPERPFDATRLVQAEADLEADLARDPGMGVLYLYMAQLWLARGHAVKARETLEGGIRADPDFAPDYARLAGLRAALGDTPDREAARTLYRRALRLEERPDWRAALAALGPA
jgi:tetratricopeptide (TPR) repeat protein